MATLWKRAQKEEMTSKRELDLAWAAGILDGEATVTLSKSNGQPNPNTGMQSYHACIQIGMADKPQNLAALEKMKALFGGYLNPSPPRGNRDFPQIIWRLTNRKAAEAARLMLPYLVIKQEQASLIIHFQNQLVYRGHVVPESVIASRDAVVARIRIINARGLSLPSHQQRLSEAAPASGQDDAIVRSHGK